MSNKKALNTFSTLVTSLSYNEPNQQYNIYENGIQYYIDINGIPCYIDKYKREFYIDEYNRSLYIDNYGIPYLMDENNRLYYIDGNGIRYYIDGNGIRCYIDKYNREFYIDEYDRSLYIANYGIPYFMDENNRLYYIDETGRQYYIDGNGIRCYIDKYNREFYIDEYDRQLYVANYGRPHFMDGNNKLYYIDKYNRPYYIDGNDIQCYIIHPQWLISTAPRFDNQSNLLGDELPNQLKPKRQNSLSNNIIQHFIDKFDELANNQLMEKYLSDKLRITQNYPDLELPIFTGSYLTEIKKYKEKKKLYKEKKLYTYYGKKIDERYLEIYFKNIMIVFTFHSTTRKNNGSVKKHNRYHAKICKIAEDQKSIYMYNEYIFRKIYKIRHKYQSLIIFRRNGTKKFIPSNKSIPTELSIESTISRSIEFNEESDEFEIKSNNNTTNQYDNFILNVIKSIYDFDMKHNIQSKKISVNGINYKQQKKISSKRKFHQNLLSSRQNLQFVDKSENFNIKSEQNSVNVKNLGNIHNDPYTYTNKGVSIINPEIINNKLNYNRQSFSLKQSQKESSSNNVLQSKQNSVNGIEDTLQKKSHSKTINVNDIRYNLHEDRNGLYIIKNGQKLYIYPENINNKIKYKPRSSIESSEKKSLSKKGKKV